MNFFIFFKKSLCKNAAKRPEKGWKGNLSLVSSLAKGQKDFPEGLIGTVAGIYL